MKIQNTDLEAIGLLLSGKPTEAAFPENLSDDHLYQISRDLLECEISLTSGETGINPPLVAPMLLIFHMLWNESAKLSGKSTYDFPQEKLQHWLPRYMHYVERELIARILNIKRPLDSGELLQEVREELALGRRY